MRSLPALLVLCVACGSETSTSEPPATPAPSNGEKKEEQAPTPAPTTPEQPKPATPEPGPALTIEGGELQACTQKELAIPAAGLAIVTHVDTTSMQRAHFWAVARALTPESPASITLEVAENGTKLKDGWDVCVGQTNPGCHANLEMNPEIAKRTFTVTVRPKASAATRANVSICVIDPLE